MNVGDKSNKLILKEKIGKKMGSNNRHLYGMFKCECGMMKKIRIDCVKNGNTKSCGCTTKVKLMIPKNNFMLTFIKEIKRKGSRCGLYKCECGNEKEILIKLVNIGHVKSCGCLSAKKTTERNTKHNMCYSSEYKSWQGMKNRCYGKNNRAYKNYGGRGIIICEHWRNSFENFYKDMGNKPSKEYQIERIDNNGNYEPTNCKWATPKEESNNRRTTKKIEYNGKTQSIAQWSEEYNISYHLLYDRLMIFNWPIEKALITPSRRKNL